MKDLTKGNPLKLILEFAIPIAIGSLLQLLYSLADTRIVGETLGDMALAAVGATNSVNTLIVGFLTGLTNGFAIMVARSFGANKEDELKKSVAATITLGIITSLVLTFFSVTFLLPLLRGLNTPENVIAQSYAYIRIIFLGMTVSMLYNVCSGILRAIGDSLTPLLFLIMSSVINIILDYTFILVLKFGVEGAAYATVIAQTVSAMACFAYMIRRYPVLRLTKKDFAFDKKMVSLMYKSGLSMGFMSSLVSLGTVALQSSINTFGINTIVAHTAARKITEIFMLPFSVFGMTMATYCGQNLGAGEIARIKKGIKLVILITWVWCIGTMIASYTVVPEMVKMITGMDVYEITDTATLYLKIDTLFYFVPAMICILRNAMQGIGDHITPVISSTIELVGKVLIVLVLTPKLEYMGIILAEPIVWILMVIPLIIQILRNPLLKENRIKTEI